MTPFHFSVVAGKPIVEQVVFAAVRAFVTGQLRPGDPFPSVRALAADLRIHPNTAHKAVQHLIQERWLEMRPGIGTVVAQRPDARAGDVSRLLDGQVEELVVEAKRVGLGLEHLTREIEQRWRALGDPAEENK